MPSFLSILKGRDGPRSKSRKNSNLSQLTDRIPAKPTWEDAWTRKTVEPDEVQELIRRCTKEIKDRGRICISPGCGVGFSLLVCNGACR